MKASFENVPLTDQGSIHAHYYQKDSFDAPWHYHPEYELTFIEKSSGIRYVGNHVSDFEAGDLVLLGPNLPHCWKNITKHDHGAVAMVIQWEENMIGDLPELAKIQSLLKRAARGIFFPKEEASKIGHAMREILGTDPFQAYLILLSVLQRLSDIKGEALAGDSYAYDLSSQTQDRLDKVQQFVRQQYAKPIRLEEVALQVSMSEQAFSRFFSKNMGRPFFVFLHEYRVNIASRMLLETDLQVAEIGFLCGYETLPFFYKQFKRFKGHTPLGFRKLYLKTQV